VSVLVERHGDEGAADLAGEFRRAMCELARDYGATQVKSMGDGVMIWAPDAAAAIAACLLTAKSHRLARD
jgi:class 3 adenylate cyclase